MSVPFQILREYKQLGLSYTAVLVKLYLDEHGPTPVGLIADACGCSIRSVEMAIAKLRPLGLLSKGEPKKNSHDHDHGDHVNKGTAQESSGRSERSCGSAVNGDHSSDDPLFAKLIGFEVLPWLVEQLLAKVERAQLERQVEYHAYRLASGFKFKGHPARYLFSACLKNYAPPQGFHQHAYVARGGIPIEPTLVTSSGVQEQSPAPASEEEKLTTITRMLRSPISSVRRMGERLAADWNIEIPDAVKVV